MMYLDKYLFFVSVTAFGEKHKCIYALNFEGGFCYEKLILFFSSRIQENLFSDGTSWHLKTLNIKINLNVIILLHIYVYALYWYSKF